LGQPVPRHRQPVKFAAVKAPGPLRASGRDADIFEYGPGLVLRRSRNGRSIEQEARTMDYVRAQGYPVPAIVEVSEDGTDLVMERIEGPTMVEAIGDRPWTVRQQARRLAELHHQLHEIVPPTFLRPCPVGNPGDGFLHMDFHPLNVILGPKGAVVIDWTNAARGDPLIDVGLAWVLMGAGQVPGPRVKAALLGWARALLVNSFMSHFDRDAVSDRLRTIVAWKVQDTNMSEDENAGMWRLVSKAEAMAGRRSR
jgi:aminoglycoside phosphotransferase (APT) family kinase protein